jgi:hypothetical protein
MQLCYKTVQIICNKLNLLGLLQQKNQEKLLCDFLQKLQQNDKTQFCENSGHFDLFYKTNSYTISMLEQGHFLF